MHSGDFHFNQATSIRPQPKVSRQMFSAQAHV